MCASLLKALAAERREDPVELLQSFALMALL